MADDNFHKLALNESFERVAKVAEERAAFNAGIEALEAENKRLREHLISALDTLKDAEVCNDECGPCNDALAALEQGK